GPAPGAVGRGPATGRGRLAGPGGSGRRRADVAHALRGPGPRRAGGTRPGVPVRLAGRPPAPGAGARLAAPGPGLGRGLRRGPVRRRWPVSVPVGGARPVQRSAAAVAAGRGTDDGGGAARVGAVVRPARRALGAANG